MKTLSVFYNFCEKVNYIPLHVNMAFIDLDRKSNGISLAETIDDFKYDPTGRSKELSLHNKWNRFTNMVLKNHETKLLKKFGKLSIPPITGEAMDASLKSIEKILKEKINTMPKGVRLD